MAQHKVKQLKANRGKRASIMIFAVVTMAAVGTILMASLDLGRLAYLKTKSFERKLRYRFHVDSIRADYEEKLYREGASSINLTLENNGIRSECVGQVDSAWENPRAYSISISSLFDQKTVVKVVKIGKRAMFNAGDFGFAAGTFTTAKDVKVDGDSYVGSTYSAHKFEVDGDLYGQAATDSFADIHSGDYIGSQPKPRVVLNSAAYQAVADTTTSGTRSMVNPSFGLLGLSSKTYYHTGTFTITGTYSGKATIFVNGNVTVNNLKPFLPTDHVVIICTGTMSLAGRDITAVLISGGTVVTPATGKIEIAGSLVTNTLTATQDLDIAMDEFLLDPLLPGFFRLPGSW